MKSISSNNGLLMFFPFRPSLVNSSSFYTTIRNRRFISTDPFIARHIGVSENDIGPMLRTIGVSSIDELIDLTIPSTIRSNPMIQKDIHKDMRGLLNERDALEKLQYLASQNITSYRTLIGQGFSGTTTPAVLKRLILENPGWYTPYTPYQAEVSQGRLEALLIYQTAICELTGMEIANASLLDESTAAAEAMLMLHRLATSKNQSKFLVSSSIHPQTRNVLRTRAQFLGIEIKAIDDYDNHQLNQLDSGDILEQEGEGVFGALVQSPDTFGRLRNFSGLSDKLHKKGSRIAAAVDPLLLAITKPPSEFGADIVVGSSQRLGLPLGGGGPHAGIFATKKEYIRQMPGRIIGRTKDSEGDEGFRMTLQTREQHIRKEKATSNICTSQALLASTSGMFVVFHGADGLKSLAQVAHHHANRLRNYLIHAGWEIHNRDNFVDTLTLHTGKFTADEVLQVARQSNFLLRKISSNLIGITFDDTVSVNEVDKLAQALVEMRQKSFNVNDDQSYVESIPSEFIRSETFLNQQIFNFSKCETEIMRYLRYLERKDLGLDWSMIPLGSCTMKLNPAAALTPILWSGFANIHPFAPTDATIGYTKLTQQLSDSLCAITDLDACSLQPNSGAAGEYAGLHVIRHYQQHTSQGYRDICLIPKTAHGTNAASAAMAGLKIKGIEVDSKTGNLNIDSLRSLVEEYSHRLSCVMITYPSTCGVFDENIKEACSIVHQHGGQVYIDGANMNAQLGLTSPGIIGADACHINLHKTFSIPHGGGGPGVGPICVKAHLAPFLPSSNTGVFCENDLTKSTVASSPFGSAMVLPITWMLIAMLGMNGLRRCGQIAILNANYMAARLKRHYPVKYLGMHGFCAHEFILDVSHFKHTAGISEEDIAKRLMDYGFHAPTMSWPLPASLMIEPTESETKAEMDRFCEAMEQIREEIKEIEEGRMSRKDNPLRNAPHPLKLVTSDTWNKPYSRTQAAFPLSWLRTRGKYWPSVARLDNSLGDVSLMCSCNDVSSFEAYTEDDSVNLPEAM